MQRVRTREELATARAKLPGRVALVPTMGALHAGHIELVNQARAAADKVIVSIFVNPLQFGAGEDFGRYPRQEVADAGLLEEAGCDLLWMPTGEDIYPAGFATTVSVSGLVDRWEGEVRPGHFDGVATVVTKLLVETRPDVALFGEKDFQQLAVIRRLVTDLGLPIEIVGVPTVREADGVALSSRNAYLSPDERSRAVALPEALKRAKTEIRKGGNVAVALESGRNALLQAGFSRVDYLALVDAATLEPIDEIKGEARLIAAAVIGSTRLIDNIAA